MAAQGQHALPRLRVPEADGRISNGSAPAPDDGTSEPEPLRLGEDKGFAARDSRQTEPSVGVCFRGCPPRPIARLRDKASWHGLAVVTEPGSPALTSSGLLLCRFRSRPARSRSSLARR